MITCLQKKKKKRSCHVMMGGGREPSLNRGLGTSDVAEGRNEGTMVTADARVK